MKQTLKGFARLHPAVGFFYFALLFISIFLYQNPILLGILFLNGIVTLSCEKGVRAAGKTVLFSLPLALFLIFINPLFNHTGRTPLFYLNGMAITLEALLYGAVTALVLMDTILWFAVFNETIGKDQVIYLFGKPFPTAALLLGMIFRATGQLRRELRDIRFAQRGLGLETEHGSLRQRLKNGASLFLCLLGNALEHSVDTAMSMRCRGYGLPGATRRRPYRFHRRDVVLLTVLLLLGAALAALCFLGRFGFTLLPAVGRLPLGGWEITGYILYYTFTGLPLLVKGREELRWRSLNYRM